MEESLFIEFPEISTKEWKQKIQFDLKGLDYKDALIWQSPEGIDVKPFYNKEDRPIGSHRVNTVTSGFKILQSIYVADVVKSNLKAIEFIKKGAEAIRFVLPSEGFDIKDLIDGIDIENIPVRISCEFLSPKYAAQIQEYLNNLKDDCYHVNFENDPIGNLVKSGNWFNSLNDDFSKFGEIAGITKSFSVDSAIYQNAGSNMVQQLAYTLAHATEYLNYLENKNIIPQFLTVNLQVAVGSNYFFEIAKLKALRILWSVLAPEFGTKVQLSISAIPSKRNKGIYDYNTNMLRTTTECMSAILGGADFIENLAYDGLYHNSNEFGDRIARNQLLILKHESYFNDAKNAANGTYYIESITNQMAEKALSIYKEIESSGGFLRQLKENKIQAKIKESAQKEQMQFDSESLKLVGTNYHINEQDKMKDNLDLYPFIKYKQRKTLIEPVIEKRLAEELEKRRLAHE